MKGTLTVRKEHYEFLKDEFKAFAVNHKIQGLIGESIETYDIEVEFETLKQFYASVLLAGMTHSFKESEKMFIKSK